MKLKQFKKYTYLGNIVPEVPEPWEPIILKILYDIDKLVRPWYFPKFVLNYMKYNKYKSFMYINKIEDLIYISQIKQKFGTLRVSTHSSTNKINEIIDLTILKCNNTCEFCGKENTKNVTVKNWIRNLCEDCINIHKPNKNNDNVIGNSISSSECKG